MVTMKNARTGQEMLDSWQELVGDGQIDDIKRVFQVFADRMPTLIENYTQKPLVESIERKNLDPKTRELVILGILAGMQCGPGLIFHIQGAIHAGATIDEILEVMFLSAYQHGKVHVAAIAQSVEEGLRRGESMKKGKPQKKKAKQRA